MLLGWTLPRWGVCAAGHPASGHAAFHCGFRGDHGVRRPHGTTKQSVLLASFHNVISPSHTLLVIRLLLLLLLIVVLITISVIQGDVCEYTCLPGYDEVGAHVAGPDGIYRGGTLFCKVVGRQAVCRCDLAAHRKRLLGHDWQEHASCERYRQERYWDFSASRACCCLDTYVFALKSCSISGKRPQQPYTSTTLAGAPKRRR